MADEPLYERRNRILLMCKNNLLHESWQERRGICSYWRSYSMLAEVAGRSLSFLRSTFSTLARYLKLMSNYQNMNQINTSRCPLPPHKLKATKYLCDTSRPCYISIGSSFCSVSTELKTFLSRLWTKPWPKLKAFRENSILVFLRAAHIKIKHWLSRILQHCQACQ